MSLSVRCMSLKLGAQLMRPGSGQKVSNAARSFKSRANIVVGKAQPTLRERLLGPTTGKPFLYGTIFLGAGSATGMGMLCYYGLGLGNEVGAFDRAGLWPKYVQARIQSTYSYLGGGLLLTAGSAAAAARSPAIMRLVGSGSIWSLFGCLAAIIGTGALVRGIEFSPDAPTAKRLAWVLHCGVMGAVLAPMCMLGGPVLIRAAWYTAGVVGGLSAVAACAPSDKFLTWGGPLSMGLGVVFVSTMGTWFLPPTTALGAGLMSVAVYGGLVLFGAFLLHDTQRVIHAAENHPSYAIQPFDPINAQMSIYLDTLNIFIRIAMILGGGGGRKK